MTIRILKQDEYDRSAIADLVADLRRLPHDELPGLPKNLVAKALRDRLESDCLTERNHVWIGREDRRITGIAVLRPLPWDSEILGTQCATLDLHLPECDQPSRKATASLLIHQALLRCRMEDTRFLSTKIGSDQFAQIHALEDSGFRLMDAEMVLRHFGPSPKPADIPGIGFEIKSDEEVEALVTMGKLFRMSRFFADPRIGAERAENLWQASVKGSCGGHADSFMVAMESTTPLAFATFMDDMDFHGLAGPSSRSFFHVGVAASAQGRGLGTALIQNAIAQSQGFDHLLVETQSRNSGALALYQKCGFRIISSRFAFHLWLD